jgi:hypothetical protein
MPRFRIIIMSAFKLTGWSAALILVCGLAGCHSTKDSEEARPAGHTSEIAKGSEHNATMEKQMKKTTHRRLIVSRENNAGRLVQIGTVNFDESNQATLSTEGSAPAAEELKKAWAEISKQKELTWKQSRPDEIGGEKVTRIVGETAKPGDDNYIYAVLNTLERKYGYTVDLAD